MVNTGDFSLPRRGRRARIHVKCLDRRRGATVVESSRVRVPFRDPGTWRSWVTSQDSRPSVNIFPADERRISEIERGRSRQAIVPLATGNTLAVGDSILFALAYYEEGQQAVYVRGGDSVRVLLTDVDDLGVTDPATGQALYQLSWEPLGQVGTAPHVATARRVVKARDSQG